MRNSCWTPSIVPGGDDQTVYLVAEDFGQLGVPGAKPTMKRRTLETVIQDLLSGQYNNPIRVVAFNTEERWSRTFPRTWLTNCAGVAIYGAKWAEE